ncbi:hypothetical protein V8245_11400 [Flavobacterium columnare]|uniref:hypothetical protein n=1 Tax=Flavobacterium columnare TaxID=996 RepID=UPI003C2CD3DA
MKSKKILFVLALMIILLIVFIEPIRAILIVVLLSIAGLAVFVSPFPLIIGILRLFFINENKKFTLQLITYSTIVLVIGSSTCGILTFIN